MNITKYFKKKQKRQKLIKLIQIGDNEFITLKEDNLHCSGCFKYSNKKEYCRRFTEFLETVELNKKEHTNKRCHSCIKNESIYDQYFGKPDLQQKRYEESKSKLYGWDDIWKTETTCTDKVIENMIYGWDDIWK